MANKGKISMLSLYADAAFNKLKFLSKLIDIESVLTQISLKPENVKDIAYDPNDCLIQHKTNDNKKKLVKDLARKENRTSKAQDKKYQIQQKKKVYKKGPFAEFYELNQDKFDKDDQVWYYKEGKQIIGPVSSYEMDKMIYHKTVGVQTRVAFKNVEKFVKFSKILKFVEDSKEEEQKVDNKEEKITPPAQIVKQEKIQTITENTTPPPVSVEIKHQTKKGLINLDDPNEFPSL